MPDLTAATPSMHANSLNLEADVAPAAASVEPVVESALLATLWEYFLRLAVVAIGIALGCVAAEIIGLLVGWIEILC